VENLGKEDPVERKKRMAREKYASLPEEQKELKRSRARGNYYRRKNESERTSRDQPTDGNFFPRRLYLVVDLFRC
jgi:hypothetical protein